MKKLNYFQAHKNKKPKKLQRRKFNLLHSKIAVLMAGAALETEILKHKYPANTNFKAIECATISLRLAGSIFKLVELERRNKYLRTKSRNVAS